MEINVVFSVSLFGFFVSVWIKFWVVELSNSVVVYSKVAEVLFCSKVLVTVVLLKKVVEGT